MIAGQVRLSTDRRRSAMRATAFVLLVFYCALWSARLPAADGEATLAIVGATVVHPERDLPGAIAAGTTILIAGNSIRTIGPAESTPVPAGAVVIDAKGKWVVPGLIDAHVHFFQSGNYYARPDILDLRRRVSFERETARNKARLPATFKVWLASGVTSVVDVGGPLWNFEVRDAARGTHAAPRVAVAGPLVSMVARPEFDLGDPPIVKVTTPEEARSLVLREIPYRPDYIKVWFIHEPGDDLARQEEIVKAAGDAAHAAGVRFAVHATELDVAKAALRAGADFLVHSVEDRPVDEEFLALARSRNVLYCPTLFVMQGYRLALSNRWQPTEPEARLADPEVLAAMRDLDFIGRDELPSWVARLMDAGPRLGVSVIALENLRRVWDAGLPVVMGTDAGNIGTLHGPSVFREMELMLQAGLTPLQVLRAATTHGAKAMHLQGRLGAVAPGMLADLVILDADPLEDIANLSRIHRVIKEGSVFAPSELMHSIH
jgi:imidazolonepropionase-like amidohydrolase